MTQTIYGSLKGKTILITGGASGIRESIEHFLSAVTETPGQST
jgi:short-subunit dehydrogenase involved in D-alanine esterification of teichoic acids